jgi:propionyl-CoA carboxylase alpha chain
VRVDTGVFEGGEISMYYDSMIAKLICHGGTRDQAISRVRDALNAFVIRGIDSNIPFQAALMQNAALPLGGVHHLFHRRRVSEWLRRVLPMSCTSDPRPARRRSPLLVVVAISIVPFKISDQMPGPPAQGRQGLGRPDGGQGLPGFGGAPDSLAATRSPMVSTNTTSFPTGGFGELVFRGTCNGAPICLQLERIGLLYRVVHFGKQVKATVMTANAARMLALMPKKVPPDLSKFLLSPMPGLLREVAVAERRKQVVAGEKLAVIEAMKMENVLKAERDCKVKKVVAKRRRKPVGRSGHHRIRISPGRQIQRCPRSPPPGGLFYAWHGGPSPAQTALRRFARPA